MGKLLLNGSRTSVCDDEKVLKTGSGNGCITQMYLRHWIVHLNMGEMTAFMLYIFCRVKKYSKRGMDWEFGINLIKTIIHRVDKATDPTV